MNSENFMPHGHCYLWRPDILWLNVGSDIVIAIAYFSIPIFLLTFLRKRKDVAFSWVFVMFALFILACGATHVMDIITVWSPQYGLAGIVKLLTAIISIATAIALWPLMPKALRLPSPAQLAQANALLRKENAQKTEMERSLIALNEELEERVAERTQAAESASRAKTVFLASMSHEIRTPLGAVLGFADLLKDNGLDQATRDLYYSAIQRNGELLGNVLKDVLDLSRVEAGTLSIENRPMNLTTLLNDLVLSLRFLADEKGIDFALHYRTRIPTLISADPLRLKQILLNVAGNAIKFTEKGSVDIEVTQGNPSLDKTAIEFLVTDTGIGIDPKQVKQLFQPFSQLDPSDRKKFGGTGLGLILARKMAQALGGDVELVSSEVGVGSTFRVTILADVVEAAELMLNQTEVIEPKSLEGMRILLAEDSADNQLLLVHIFKNTGAILTLANNGAEAVELAQENDFDLILMDLQMPVMDGYEAFEKIRANGFSGGVWALTAHAFSEVRRKCKERGFDDYHTKPIKSAALIQQIALYRANQKQKIFSV